MKHAQASTVQVTLSWIGDQVVLDIEDDGAGFVVLDEDDEHGTDLTAITGIDGGFGLQAMQERVTQSGGELHIESVPSEGTTVTAILPLGTRI